MNIEHTNKLLVLHCISTADTHKNIYGLSQEVRNDVKVIVCYGDITESELYILQSW